MKTLSLIFGILICGSGHFFYKKFSKGFLLLFFFSTTLSLGLYRFFIDEIVTNIAISNQFVIKLSFCYFALTFIIWLYNLVDILELMSRYNRLPETNHYEEGRIASLTGDYVKAKEHFEKALQINSGDKDALFQLGRSYHHLNMKVKAKKIFEKYLNSGDKKWVNEIEEMMEEKK